MALATVSSIMADRKESSPYQKLPNELLCQIALCLNDAADLRSLRLVNRKTSKATLPALFQTLTLRPTTTSFQHAIELIRDSRYVKYVHEIILDTRSFKDHERQEDWSEHSRTWRNHGVMQNPGKRDMYGATRRCSRFQQQLAFGAYRKVINGQIKMTKTTVERRSMELVMTLCKAIQHADPCFPSLRRIYLMTEKLEFGESSCVRQPSELERRVLSFSSRDYTPRKFEIAVMDLLVRALRCFCPSAKIDTLHVSKVVGTLFSGFVSGYRTVVSPFLNIKSLTVELDQYEEELAPDPATTAGANPQMPPNGPGLGASRPPPSAAEEARTLVYFITVLPELQYLHLTYNHRHNDTNSAFNQWLAKQQWATSNLNTLILEGNGFFNTDELINLLAGHSRTLRRLGLRRCHLRSRDSDWPTTLHIVRAVAPHLDAIDLDELSCALGVWNIETRQKISSGYYKMRTRRCRATYARMGLPPPPTLVTFIDCNQVQNPLRGRMMDYLCGKGGSNGSSSSNINGTGNSMVSSSTAAVIPSTSSSPIPFSFPVTSGGALAPSTVSSNPQSAASSTSSSSGGVPSVASSTASSAASSSFSSRPYSPMAFTHAPWYKSLSKASQNKVFAWKAISDESFHFSAWDEYRDEREVRAEAIAQRAREEAEDQDNQQENMEDEEDEEDETEELDADEDESDDEDEDDGGDGENASDLMDVDDDGTPDLPPNLSTGTGSGTISQRQQNQVSGGSNSNSHHNNHNTQASSSDGQPHPAIR